MGGVLIAPGSQFPTPLLCYADPLFRAGGSFLRYAYPLFKHGNAGLQLDHEGSQFPDDRIPLPASWAFWLRHTHFVGQTSLCRRVRNEGAERLPALKGRQDSSPPPTPRGPDSFRPFRASFPTPAPHP